ncbi:MAG TPA: DUF721 domain-containing protein [Bryobacteraceae bacterium]|nr:DUF721 domain-containing protein [Bryobacteraceae bacterium]
MERAGRLISKLKLPDGILGPEDLARAIWPIAAGKRIAAHTKVASLVRNTLIIEVEDPLWQRNLYALRSFLLRNLNDAIGAALIEDLEFRPMVMRRQPQRATTPKRAPEMQAQPDDDADRIADPFLQRAYKTSRKKASA